MVELMVAIALGLLLTTAVISVFVGSRQAYQSTSGIGALSDGGRVALNLLSQSARSAGYLACNSSLTGKPDTLLGATTLANDFGTGITGFEASGTGPRNAVSLPNAPAVGAAGDWTPSLDPAVIGSPGGPPVKGSDVLVLRSTAAGAAILYTTGDVAPGASSVNVSRPSQLAAGEYGVISDCAKSVIFQTTGGPGGGVVNFNGPLGPDDGFVAGALVAPVSTTVYYVGRNPDGVSSSLWRLQQINGGAFTADEVVPDVENMQVLYGIDPAGTQTASAYVTADQVGATPVVSIRVAVLAASPPGNGVQAVPAFELLKTSVTAPTDSRLRKVFSETITLRDAVH
jgi:type IV pilus assembly protein PilW